MSIACNKKNACFYLKIRSEMSAYAETEIRCKRRMLKKIIVDETLLKLDRQEYWLWIAYEPNPKSCLMMYLSRIILYVSIRNRWFFIS